MYFIVMQILFPAPANIEAAARCGGGGGGWFGKGHRKVLHVRESVALIVKHLHLDGNRPVKVTHQ